jgi:regulatory protein
VIARKAGSYSRRAIVEALKSQGVAGDTIDEALTAHELDDESAMRALWERRFGRAPADEREKARQVRFLQSRGFSLSAILRLLRSLEA